MAKPTRYINWGSSGHQSVADGGDGTLYYSAFQDDDTPIVARTNVGIEQVTPGVYRITPVLWNTSSSGYEVWDTGLTAEAVVGDFEADVTTGIPVNEANHETVEEILEA